eukprot:TRINITY_DN220_c0_g1_i1.p1 TRINITY_DN220_c0_g1~~TRINITY_DN220_c0_g1_i1.p1  ORF type:complete len:243 (+),score=58.18 TRINITY_DN220_c0_g1_i1:58-786(+)
MEEEHNLEREVWKPFANPAGKVKPTECYGFVLWVSTFVAYALFLLWSFMPNWMLESMGVTYYPSKYWAIALPNLVWILLVVLILAYMAINLMNTNPLDSLFTVTDQFAHFMDKTEQRSLSVSDYSIPEVSDIPIGIINRIFYQIRPSISSSFSSSSFSSNSFSSLSSSLLPSTFLSSVSSFSSDISATSSSSVECTVPSFSPSSSSGTICPSSSDLSSSLPLGRAPSSGSSCSPIARLLAPY